MSQEISTVGRKTKQPRFDEKLLDELLSGYKKPEDLAGSAGIFQDLKKALLERALGAELTEHLGYEPGEEQSEVNNARNGYSKKTVTTDTARLEIEVPRDRAGTFEPKIVRKYQTRLPGFDDKVISMYARGLSVREIQGHLEELYGIAVSPDLISRVTDAVHDEIKAWQSRPLEPVYPVIFFDALRVKIRHEGIVRNKAVYLALGIRMDGLKEVLGLWIEPNEGAKFWLLVMNELKNRGVRDVLIAVIDGLRGFPEAINAVFPETQIQTCIVHLVRHSLNFVSWKDRKNVAIDLRAIYGAATATAARERLAEFAASWGGRYPSIAPSWERAWEQVIPFFNFPPEIRKVIYTTNAIESLHSVVRKTIKNRGHFPDDVAATKLIYLALRNIEKKWTMPARSWKEALNQFAVLYKDRLFAAA